MTMERTPAFGRGSFVVAIGAISCVDHSEY